MIENRLLPGKGIERSYSLQSCTKNPPEMIKMLCMLILYFKWVHSVAYKLSKIILSLKNFEERH